MCVIIMETRKEKLKNHVISICKDYDLLQIFIRPALREIRKCSTDDEYREFLDRLNIIAKNNRNKLHITGRNHEKEKHDYDMD